MEEKKNVTPRRDGGHKNDRRPRQGADRYEEGGQRISVRPGNFNPPPPKSAKAPVTNETKSPKTGSDNSENRQNRNGRNQNRRNHGNRPVAQPRNKSNANPHSPVAESNQKNNQNSENRNGKGRNKGDRRQDRRDRTETQRTQADILSASLQEELNAEFDTSVFSSFSSFAKKDAKKEAQAVDSKEFAVDIATAGYLVEDVPCGFPIPDGTAVEVVGVRFRHAGKMYFFSPAGFDFRIGDEVLVDTARGEELGEIVMLKRKIAEKDVIQPLRAVLRHATDEDKIHERENRAKEAEALKICAAKIAAHKLDMQLVDAQYTFDNSKLLFYFTSEGRVDFRELVRDLASVFHTRIELRQIGIRDESRLIGGLGMCGRPFCCSTFLSDFGQVSIKMAKEQGLSINTSKISGCCGRLMCCLRYEHEAYTEEARLTPKKDTAVSTPDGNGVVVDATPLAGTVKVRLDSAPEEAPKTYHRDTVTVLAARTPANGAESPLVSKEDKAD